MVDKVVVVYGAGASYASGYKVTIIIDDERYSEKPLMDKDFFTNRSVKKLVEIKYCAISKFIDWYFGGRKNVGLEELWTAVDLNHKHITLDTYGWNKETEEYQTGEYYTNSGAHTYPSQEIISNYTTVYGTNIRGATSTQPLYSKFRFLGDCVRNLKELICDSLTIFDVGKEENLYLKLHKQLECTGLLGYITFNYDLFLEDTLYHDNDPLFRYLNVNEEISQLLYSGINEHLIIKLHGSLNWEHSSKGRPITFLKSKEAVYPDYRQSNAFVEPAIIPPTLFKQEINDEARAKDPLTQVIIQQWIAAIRLLTDADKWIFVGYSFPPTDFHAKRIFQIAMMRRRSLGKKTKVLYCGGSNSNIKEVEEELQDIFVLELGKEIILTQGFENLCESNELKKFLQ